MSYTNGTPFLDLPQTVGNDHRDWFDTNAAFLDLDAKMKTLWDGAASTTDILEQLQETVSGLDTDLEAVTTTVGEHTTTLQTVSESLVLINNALTSLNTDVRTKFDNAGIADPYDPTYGTYDVDDVVTYNGQRYKCVTAVTASEPFDADKWLAEDVQTVIDQLNSDLADVNTALTRTQTLISEQTNPLLKNYVRVLKYGDVVDISLNGLQDLVGQTNNKIFTLPEGLRPLNIKYFGFAVSSYEYEISIATNGDVYVFPVEVSPVYQDSIRLELTYII